MEKFFFKSLSLGADYYYSQMLDLIHGACNSNAFIIVFTFTQYARLFFKKNPREKKHSFDFLDKKENIQK